MKPLIKRIAASAVSVCFVIGTLQAQTDQLNVVTSAVPFLRISPDARAGGMGELGTATAPDVNAQFYNLAKYPFAKTKTR